MAQNPEQKDPKEQKLTKFHYAKPSISALKPSKNREKKKQTNPYEKTCENQPIYRQNNRKSSLQEIKREKVELPTDPDEKKRNFKCPDEEFYEISKTQVSSYLV